VNFLDIIQAAILKQIESLVFQRKDTRKPGISLVFIMNTLNIEDLPDFVKLAGNLGVDEILCNYMVTYTPAHLKFSCFFQQELTNKMLKEAEEIAKSLNLRISLPPKFASKEFESNLRCNELWKYFYVETEGSVLPCCFAGSHVGYLNKEDFSAIWNGQTYQDLRRSLIEGNLNDRCKHCFKNNPLNVNKIRAHVTFQNDLQEKILKGIKL
jgi:radical SAM protein with 4Fe4S-binding SPASM domain